MLILNEDVFQDLPDVDADIVVTETEIEPEGPAQGADTGIANVIHDLIIDENEAIQGYNNAAANMTQYPELMKLMQDIAGEELAHVGELQKALEVVSPNAIKIAEGEVEADEKLDPGSPVDESLTESISEDKKDLVLETELFYDRVDNLDEGEVELFTDLGFVDSNSVVIPAGTKLTNAGTSGGVSGFTYFFVNDNPDNEIAFSNEYIDELMDACGANALRESSNPREITDNLIDAVDGGLVSCYEVMMACLKYMSEDQVEDMCRMNDFNVYRADEVDEDMDATMLAEADLHPKFKKDYKNQYKDWDREQQKVRDKRAQFDDEFEMTDVKKNADPDKWNEVKDIVAGKEKDFELQKRDNLEDKNYPFYVTFYSEYPIYEPAEGGYYYAGRNAEYSKGFDSIEDAQKFAEEEMQADSSVDWSPIEIKGAIKGYRTNEKYIGEDQYITIENNDEYLSDEAGYEPYQ